METREIEIQGKKYKIQELKHKEAAKILTEQDAELRTKNLIVKSVLEPELKLEDIDELPIKVTLNILKEINSINGFGETNFR